MSTTPHNKLIEELSEKIHHLYCEQFLKDNGVPYWTNGDYSKLDESTKEYDRNIARYIFDLLATREAQIYEDVTALHVKARKFYSRDSWDDGYHEALFAVARILVRPQQQEEGTTEIVRGYHPSLDLPANPGIE